MATPIIKIQDYTYSLPEDRIAIYPLEHRDQAKLLVYKKGTISHKKFTQLADLLPSKSILFFNNTKVIQARFLFTKPTGATIEVFLLNPVPVSKFLSTALNETSGIVWKCKIGNLKRWSEGLALSRALPGFTLNATLLDREQGLVRFSWDPPLLPFGSIIQAAGCMPLPPYLKRDASPEDLTRYQTVYSDVEGAVAAPTAGLHFTPDTFESLRTRSINIDFLCLHVGAGTFLPVKVENALEHTMHAEQIVINQANLVNLQKENPVIAVGTTSLRTLESVYWYGVKLIQNPTASFEITSTDPYLDTARLPSRSESVQAVLDFMVKAGISEMTGSTSIYIYPGYRFRMCDGLITNFHQPGSTLLLLIAAFVGPDWKRIYHEALAHHYRFLSYGDSSLLLPL